MIKRTLTKTMLATSLFLYSGATYAGFPGDFLQKLGDAASDVLSLGENGRARDRERANADARYFEMQAQMQRMQLNQQVQYLKNQIQIVFGYYCDDMSKLEKVHNLQSETFRTIAAFKGALTFAKKIENNTANFQKISGNVKAQLDRISLQFDDAFDANSGKSIFSLNDSIREIVTLAQQSQEDTNMYVAYIMKNIADNKESLVSNLSMMNLLMANIHQLLKSLELDITNQLLRSSHLNQSGLAQLFILDVNQTPVFDIHNSMSSCTFRFRAAHEPYRSSDPESLEYMADLIRSNPPSNPMSNLRPLQEMVHKTAENAAEVINQFTQLADTLERTIVQRELNRSDWDQLSYLNPQTLKEHWFMMQLKRIKRWGSGVSEDQFIRVTRNQAEYNPLFRTASFRDSLKVLAQEIATNFSNPNSNSKEEIVSYITMTLDYAEANKIKKETVLAALIQSFPQSQSDTIAKLYKYSKERIRTYSKAMTQYKIASEMLATVKSQNKSVESSRPNGLSTLPPIPVPMPAPIPPPRGYGR